MSQIRTSALVFRTAIVMLVIGGITFTLKQLLPVNATTAGFAYLLAILFVATKWGLVEAVIGSLTAVLCFNFFFLPPVGTFTIADPQNWIALFTLLATSITASRLSTRVRQQAIEAQQREKEIERLYALSRSILLIDPEMPAASQVVNQVRQVLEADSVALYDRASTKIFRSGSTDFPEDDETLRAGASDDAVLQATSPLVFITPVRLGSQPIGSLGINGIDLSDSALQSLANLVAIGLERARAQEAAGRAEAARQSDELKSTLLDAIAHEFKTPLTTIKASTTALLSDKPPKPEHQRDYIALVDEEADRLGGLVTEAIQMARIEAGQVRVQLEETPVTEMIESVLAKTKAVVDDRPVQVAPLADVPPVMMDREMMELAFRQLIENAVKYSPPGSPLAISAAVEDDQVVVRVRDRGKGIPEAEQKLIFEKFYRAKQTFNQVPGAGLGLAIAKAVIDAHHGRIWVESTPDSGSTFCIALAKVQMSVS